MRIEYGQSKRKTVNSLGPRRDADQVPSKLGLLVSQTCWKVNRKLKVQQDNDNNDSMVSLNLE